MTTGTSLVDRIRAISPRERRLIGLMFALALVIGLVYGVLAPGLAAQRSAENRRAEAAGELAAARTLAASMTARPAAIDFAALRTSAEAAGLYVTETGNERLRVRGPGPAAILAWLAAAKDVVPANVAIEAETGGGSLADIRLRPAP